MATYLDDQGNPIKSPAASGVKAPVYLDDKGEPIQAAAAAKPEQIPTMQAAPPATTMEKMGDAASRGFEWATGSTPSEVGQRAKELGKIALEEGGTLLPEIGAPGKALPEVLSRGAGAVGGASLGMIPGEYFGGKWGARLGDEKLGREVGGDVGAVAGGALGLISPDLVKAGIKKFFPHFQEAEGLGKVGSAAQERGYEPPVLTVPEPKLAKRMTPEQIPGPDTAGKGNLLTPLARSGEEGAGGELQRRGRKVLFTVPEDVNPPKMKMTFGEQGGHAGGGVSSEEEIARPGKNYIVKSSGASTYHGKSFAPEETPKGGAHVTVLPDGSIRTNAGHLSPSMEKAFRKSLE